MRSVFPGLLFLSIVLTSSCILAKEPLNLAVPKQVIVHYHDSGDYDKDLNRAMNSAMQYLISRINHPSYRGKPAIILDIDETSLSNYPHLVKADFGGTIEDVRRDEDKGIDKAILPTLKLYQFAKAHHLSVFFLTGRHAAERDITAENLKKVGYDDWDGLILRSDKYEKTPAAIYKTAMRKQLTEQGYDIILNVGDQYSDLRGGYAEKTFKLPNPFYLIP